MSYEKEVAELWKEWKKSTEKYEEAIEDGYDVDADMWSHDVMEIERKIYVYEQATKADEYEPKAKAWDRTQALLEKCTHQTPGDDYEVDWHEFEIKIDEVMSDYESECDSNA